MPAQINVEQIIADNRSIDIELFKKSEEALKELQRTGAVRRSTYGLGSPEAKQNPIHHGEDDGMDHLLSFRRLR
jgi:hypothetical protein